MQQRSYLVPLSSTVRALYFATIWTLSQSLSFTHALFLLHCIGLSPLTIIKWLPQLLAIFYDCMLHPDTQANIRSIQGCHHQDSLLELTMLSSKCSETHHDCRVWVEEHSSAGYMNYMINSHRYKLIVRPEASFWSKFCLAKSVVATRIIRNLELNCCTIA